MKLNLHESARLISIVVGILFLWNFSLSAADCNLDTTIRDATIEEIKAFFASQKKDVATFVGYSGADYEDKDAMLETAKQILDVLDDSKTIVNIDATPEGIGAVYELAKRSGFLTTGILSTQAKGYNAVLSPCVDYVFYVEDATLGGFIEGGEQLSPTSTAKVEISDVLIAIGGGEIGRDELLAAKRLEKEIRFFPADMNHQKAREEAQKKRLPEPTNFGGAAGEMF